MAERKLAGMARGLALIALLAAGAGGLVTLSAQLTRERIQANEREWALRVFHEIVPPHSYDNELLDDTIRVVDEDLLGSSGPRTIYRARRGGEPVAAVLDVIAPNGYSGAIDLLVGVRADGELLGVRVTAHRETPGLGDGIETAKSDWITRFAGRSLGNPPIEEWAVERDGGNFDQFTGATVTPRAVVSAVRDALLYFERHRDTIFATPAATSDEREEP